MFGMPKEAEEGGGIKMNHKTREDLLQSLEKIKTPISLMEKRVKSEDVDKKSLERDAYCLVLYACAYHRKDVRKLKEEK